MKSILIGLLFACAAFPLSALAVPLTYSSNATISLASPAATFTILAGSLADSVQVNATSVMVTLSSSTGGSFTLTSASYDLTVASSSAGGSASVSCSGDVETATLSQNTGSSVYAITPSTTDCANASPPVINGVAATGITTNGATIAWTTNIPAESTVSYGTTTSYGATSTNPTLVTAHSVSLSNLNAGTLYHYAIASSDYGTSTTSGDNTFATATLTSAGASSVNVGGGGSAYDASINGGAATTPTPSVTLSLYGTEAYTMEVSNTSTFAGATWIPYATALPWTLAPGLGTETVYAQFRSVAGTILGTAQASIDLVSAGTMGSATSSSPSSATVPASPSSAASLTAELASLQAKLAALLKQAGQASTATAPASIHFVFTRNLSLGMTSNDVKQLQAFLAKNPVLYPQDKVTGYFGTLTLKAVQRFQAKYGIAKAGQSVYGYVGPATRAMLNSLIEKGLSP